MEQNMPQFVNVLSTAGSEEPSRRTETVLSKGISASSGLSLVIKPAFWAVRPRIKQAWMFQLGVGTLLHKLVPIDLASSSEGCDSFSVGSI